MNLDQIFLSDEKMTKLEGILTKSLQNYKSMISHVENLKPVPKKIADELSKLGFIFEESLNKKQKVKISIMDSFSRCTYTDSLERGSASNPVTNGNFSVGMFGSVWADFYVEGFGNVRVTMSSKYNTEGFNPQYEAIFYFSKI